MAPPNWPALIVEGGFVTTSPVVPSGTFILDDTSFGVLDSSLLGDSVTWSDITQWVRSGSVNRPGNRLAGPLWQYQQGSASVVLNNADGRFDPDNLGGPYVAAGATQLNAMVPVRVRAMWSGVTYPLFRGNADSWGDDGANYGGRYAQATLAASDGQKILNGITLATLGSAVGASEHTGARINRILNAASWYTSADNRQIATGDSTVQATTFGDSAWNLMQLTADSETGELYVDGSGTVVFRNRAAILSDARSAFPQATFGDLTVPGGLNPFPLGDDANFEGGTLGSWEANTNCTVAVSSAQAHSGSKSMSVTATAAGVMTADDGTNFLPCPPGATVVVSVWFRAAANARQCQAGVQFFDGSGTLLSTQKSSTVNDSASGWTLVSTQQSAPAGTAKVRAHATVVFAQASEVHYIDDISLFMPEIPYYSVTRSRDDAALANDVQATRVGGALQEATSAASVQRYLFPRSYQRTDLILENDTAASEWAQWVLYIASDDSDRFDQLTIYPLRDPANLWPQALGREIGDRIRVVRRPPGVSAPVAKDCFIRGISHTWDVSAGTWATTFTLQSAAKYVGNFLILDDAGNGKLDTNILGFF